VKWVRTIIEVAFGVFVELVLDLGDILLSTFLNELKEPVLLPDIIKCHPSHIKRAKSRDRGCPSRSSSWGIVYISDDLLWVLQSLYYILFHEINPFEDV
jgi:hypothetical protein